MLGIEINSSLSTPIYKQIAEQIESDVATGKLSPGTMLPSEPELSKELGVARGTIRKAISTLVSENVLEKSQGKGTFVKKAKISYPFAQELISYAETMKKKGIEFKTIVLKQEMRIVPPEIRKIFDVPENTKLLYLERLREVEGTPTILLKNWVNVSYLPGFKGIDFTKEGLFEAIEKYGNIKLNYGIRNFTATISTPEQKKLLRIKEPTALLKINQFTYDKNNKLIEYSDVFLQTDKYEVTSLLYR